MISHDIHAAARYASHILHVSRRPLFYGTKEDYVLSDIGQQYGCKVAV
jgi:zinc transport system ATP-binding protein